MTESDPLETKYIHQNPSTGQVSGARLTLRQLCRLLCPANEETSAASAAPTQVLRVLPDGSYSTKGWEPAQSVPVLCEAVSQWYYDENGQSKGPITCRQIAEAIDRGEISDHHTRLYSVPLGEWKVLSDIPDLKIALKAFERRPAAEVTISPTTEEYNATAAMPVETVTNDELNETPPEAAMKEVQDELEAFLASTDKLGNQSTGDDADDEDGEAYESDGGTRYVKDWRTGNWVHEALVAPRSGSVKGTSKESSNDGSNSNKRQNESSQQTIKKRKKSKFSAKNAKCWIYITGLPFDATEEEVATFCSKVGILDLDPETQRPKVKVYRFKEGAQVGQGKGDASVCYARPESVDLALTVLDEALFRPENDLKRRVHVERAKFEQHGSVFHGSRVQKVSTAKRKVVQMAVKQAMDWDGGEYNGRLTGGLKGLRIIVLQPMFTSGASDDVLAALEQKIRTECETCGAVEKITIFASNPRGVVVVKFTQPMAASEAIKLWDGRRFEGNKVEATFWDGVTDYTVRDEAKEQEEMEKRQEEFGNWLESQDLPEELQLKTET